MKPIHASLIAMTGLLALLNNPLLAQEAPPPGAQSGTVPKVAEPPALPSRRSAPVEGERIHKIRQGPVEEVPTAFIGVLTGSVPRELRSHFSLAEGFGLLVEEVMPDTPAQAAGLKVDDILVRFEDQKLVNMEQLQTLVRSKKKDEVVSLTVISGGTETQVPVKIGERMMPVRHEGARGMERYFTPFDRSSFFENEPKANEMRESVERYQKQMREYQERMRDWSRDGNKGAMPPAPSWGGPGRRDGGRRDGPDSSRDGDRGSRNGPRDGEHRSERHEYRETANVTRSDDSGIYSLRRDGERTVFTAKPKDGAEQSWNVNNDEERRAIPEPMKEKLRQLEEIRGSEGSVPKAERGSLPPEGQESPTPGAPKPAGGI